jgi:hypothetical protein
MVEGVNYMGLKIAFTYDNIKEFFQDSTNVDFVWM